MVAIFDEMNGFGDGVRAPYRAFVEWLGVQHMETLRQKSAEAEVLFRRSGITFAVYGNDEAAERLIPFDILPRIIGADEWRNARAGDRAARQGAQRLSLRHLPSPGDFEGRQGARGTDNPELGLSARDDRRRPSTVSLQSHHRHRSRPLQARTTSRFSKTTRARRPASPTCWRTARR